jgi:predicted Zn-ribbon and HTH transcriptional regulator
MTIRENIISDLSKINNPALLNQIFEYIQLLKQNKALKINNREKVLSFAGSLDNKQTKEIQKLIADEFDNIEGEW